MRKTLLFIILLLYNAMLTPTYANSDSSPVSSVMLGYGRDAYDTNYWNIYAATESKDFHQFSFGFGQTITTTKSLNSSQYSLAVATNPYKKFSIGVNFNHWAYDNSLKTQSLSSDFYYNYDDWSFIFGAQFNTTIFNEYDYTLASKAISVSISNYSFGNTFFGINYYNNQYENNLFSGKTTAQKDRILLNVSDRTQLLISSLEKERIGISAGYFFNQASIEFTWSIIDSALVEEKIISNSLISDYQLNRDFSLSLVLSRNISTVSNDVFSIADLSINYQW